eukprot:377784-Rhodomonas_salina.1
MVSDMEANALSAWAAVICRTEVLLYVLAAKIEVNVAHADAAMFDTVTAAEYPVKTTETAQSRIKMMRSALIKGMKLAKPLGPGALRNSLLTRGEEPSRSGPTGISAATSSGCVSWKGVAMAKKQKADAALAFTPNIADARSVPAEAGVRSNSIALFPKTTQGPVVPAGG